jgi:hypothetical protein
LGSLASYFFTQAPQLVVPFPELQEFRADECRKKKRHFSQLFPLRGEKASNTVERT